jgi:hypothetical protein
MWRPPRAVQGVRFSEQHSDLGRRGMRDSRTSGWRASWVVAGGTRTDGDRNFVAGQRWLLRRHSTPRRHHPRGALQVEAHS